MAACGLRLYWQTVPRYRSCSVRGAWGVGRRESVCHASSLWFGGQRVGRQVARPCQCSARARTHVAVWLPGVTFLAAAMWGRGFSPSGRNRCGPKPRRDTWRDNRDQVCLHVVTAVGPRVFRPPGPEMFAAFWDDGLPHGSRFLRAGEVVETLLPVEQGSTFADEAIRCQWRDNGGSK